ncbi:uncharacterized protein LOC107867167 [Capsicum annuum]|uniref:uncharacterized protein LOC107867167 n=1 Tax=Capsicum annuum TaxID=4072 RepID=UPI0007BF7ED5|nr:uncharacterized protein LOC107867167 [Capsicum annuum]
MAIHGHSLRRRYKNAAEEIQKNQCPELFNVVTMGFSIDEEDDAIASHRPNAATGEPENTTGPTAFTGASDNENAGAFEAGSQQANTQGEYTRSSNVDEKEKCKKRKRIAENDNETFRKGMMEVI